MQNKVHILITNSLPREGLWLVGNLRVYRILVGATKDREHKEESATGLDKNSASCQLITEHPIY